MLSICLDICKLEVFTSMHLAGTLYNATYSMWPYIDIHSIYETIVNNTRMSHPETSLKTIIRNDIKALLGYNTESENQVKYKTSITRSGLWIWRFHSAVVIAQSAVGRVFQDTMHGDFVALSSLLSYYLQNKSQSSVENVLLSFVLSFDQYCFSVSVILHLCVFVHMWVFGNGLYSLNHQKTQLSFCWFQEYILCFYKGFSKIGN